MSAPLLEVAGLTKVFLVGRKFLRSAGRPLTAVNRVSLRLQSGEVLGVVGESGCGKSTLARLVLRLVEPTAGDVLFDGVAVTGLGRRALRDLRADMQMVFQDPNASLNPAMTVGQAIAETLRFHGKGTPAARRRAAMEMLEVVGLTAQHFDRRPHELSGGQNQRVSIARATVIRPKLLVLDEPVSALDVSIQAQVLKLLIELKNEFSLSYLFISHDLAVVRRISDRVAVLYLGRVVETAPTETLFAAARHPYTQGLLRSRPIADPRAIRAKEMQGVQGDLPSPLRVPPGCAFATRCPLAVERCRTEVPALEALAPGHEVACFRAAETGAGGALPEPAGIGAPGRP